MDDDRVDEAAVDEAASRGELRVPLLGVDERFRRE